MAKVCPRGESNSQPQRPQRRALSIELRRLVKAIIALRKLRMKIICFPEENFYLASRRIFP